MNLRLKGPKSILGFVIFLYLYFLDTELYFHIASLYSGI